MKKSLFAIVTASALLAGAGLAAAQTSTTTTTTWTDAEGNIIRQDSTSQHYNSITDPSLQPSVGAELPSTVTLYPLPQTVTVPDPGQYSYTIINQHPVVVESTTRKVVHTW